MTDPHPYAVVLAGGSGTRFWPASRRAVPKQMLPLVGDEPLVRTTVVRLFPLVPPERVLVVTAAARADEVRAVLPELPAENVLGEPRARNTAAACALAALRVGAVAPDAPLLTLPADHVIRPDEELLASLAAAADRAHLHRRLVTLGLRPTRPATGYGWIEVGEQAGAPDRHPVHHVESFREKPDLATAERYLASGRYLWNLGIFAWRPDVFIEELAAHLPGVLDPLRPAVRQLDGPDGEAALAQAFDEVLPISVDYGVLERSSRIDCLPCTFDWDDLGSFAALARHLPPDEHGNVPHGALLALDSTGCISWAEEDRMTALLGVEDLIVVHANGVTMVAPRDRAEEVKRLAEALGAAGLERFA